MNLFGFGQRKPSLQNGDGSGSSGMMLEARDVRFGWDGNEVLRGLSLSVPRGTVVCLMGVNGCGKSTFLDCVLGENIQSSGDIYIDGKAVRGLPPRLRARLMAYVPQFQEQVFPYSVEHFVLMGRTAYQSGVSSFDNEDQRAAVDALRKCGVEHLTQRTCTSLSGGELQMVMLARALAQDTPLIVLDEPTAHLDFKNELLFLETIERLVLNEGKTVLMATHSPNQAFHLEAAGVAVEVSLMQSGAIASQGRPAEVLTPMALRNVFGVQSVLVDAVSQRVDGGSVSMQQIVPVHVLDTGVDAL